MKQKISDEGYFV
jgi:hypothetical protein